MDAIEEKWERAGISDDFIFRKVMLKPRLCKRLLEMILQVEIREIVYVEDEKTIDLKKNARGVRLDVYICDDEGTVYNVEIQTRDKKDLPKRTRYYQSTIDGELLKKGVPYQKLNRCFVIFICLFDVFGAGRHVYTFENLCKEDTSIALGDETTRIFLNTKGTMDDVSPEMHAFLRYVGGETSEDSFVQELETEVKFVKLNEDWRREFMTLEDLLKDSRDEGRAEGWAKGRVEGRAEGRVEGRAEGQAKEREENILNVLMELRNVGKTARMLKRDYAEVWKVAEKNRIPVEDRPN